MPCEINGVAENLYSVLSEAYSEHIHASKIERFAKIDKGWIALTAFTKRSVLDVWLGSEYVSDYSGVFFIIIIWGCHFESSKNVSNLMSILFKYLELKFTPYVQ